jgi:hypothetical protein
MTIYHFNIRDGSKVAMDEEGMDLPSLDAAIREAETSGRELLADMVREGTPLDGQAVEITNEAGTVLKSIRLKSLFWISA